MTCYYLAYDVSGEQYYIDALAEFAPVEFQDGGYTFFSHPIICSGMIKWRVSEASSGLAFQGNFVSSDEAIQNAKEQIAKHRDKLSTGVPAHIAKYGPSPWVAEQKAREMDSAAHGEGLIYVEPADKRAHIPMGVA